MVVGAAAAMISSGGSGDPIVWSGLGDKSATRGMSVGGPVWKAVDDGAVCVPAMAGEVGVKGPREPPGAVEVAPAKRMVCDGGTKNCWLSGDER